MNSEPPKPESTVYQKAVQGSMWLFSLHYFGRALDLIRAVVLARLLLPRDFGQMAIALLSVAILERFTQVGIGEALIQRKGDIREHLDTAWTIGILRGFFIFGLLFVCAPWIALFFDGSGQLRATDIKANRIAFQIRTHPNPATAYLLEHMQEESRAFLLTYDPNNVFPDERKEKLIQDLNHIIASERLWEHSSFSNMLSERPQKILEQKIQAGDVQRANRVILEEIFAEDKGIQPVILDRKLVTGIIQVVGLVFLIGSMGNIGVVYFRRDLQFGRQFLFGVAGMLAGTTAAILAAVAYRSVWALVIGRLTGTVVTCTLSYFLHPYRPHWQLKMEKSRSLWKYGQHVMWTSILDFLIQQGDSIFVGKILGTATLGLYRYAHRFSNLGCSEVQEVIRKVSFPAFSRIQGDTQKVISGYKKTIRYITILAYPICGGLLVLAPEFVSVILGSAWVGMIPTMQVLCIMSALHCVLVGIIFRSQGRPDFQTKVSAVRLGFIALSIYPLTHWLGLVGTGLSLTASALFIFPLQFGYLKQLIGFSLLDFLRLVFVPFAGTAVMMVGLAILKPLIPLGDLGRLIVSAAIGAVLYVGTVYLLSFIDREYHPYQFYKGIRKGWE